MDSELHGYIYIAIIKGKNTRSLLRRETSIYMYFDFIAATAFIIGYIHITVTIYSMGTHRQISASAHVARTTLIQGSGTAGL